MKERILSGWSFTRALYLVIGTYLLVQSIIEKQWVGAALGGYFASMGVFAFGCASGNCVVKKESKEQSTITDVEFEEVKTK